jgi:hypothetical protein
MIFERARSIVARTFVGASLMAVTGCAPGPQLTVPIEGASGTNPLLKSYYEVIELPMNFHWASAESGPPGSWVVLDMEQINGMAGYVAVTQAQYHGGKATLDPAAILIATDPKPAASPKSAAEAMALKRKGCLDSLSRTEIRKTDNDYFFEASGPPRGVSPQEDWLVRLAFGERAAFTVMYVTKGRRLSGSEKEQAIELISSFKVERCQNPSAGCFQPIGFSATQRQASRGCCAAPAARRRRAMLGWFIEGFATADLKDAGALLEELNG